MATDKKFDQFTPGGEMMVGDQPVGLRPADLTKNYIFDFPGAGIKDSNGNYLFQYDTVGASAVNYPKLINSVTGSAVLFTADGTDSAVDVSVQPKGTGQLILDELKWPTSDGVPNSFMFTDGFGNLGFTTGSVATAIVGTANQVLANGTSGISQSGVVTLTTPQDIATTSSPTFANLTLTNPLPVASGGTGLATYTTNGMLFASSAGVIGQVTPANRASLISNATGVPSWASLTDGQIIIGSTAGVPAAASLTAGAGVSITPGSNSISIAATSGAGSPLTTKGDLYTFSTVNDRLPVGTINGQILQVASGASTGLAYSTATYPATTTANRILYSSATSVVGEIASAASAILFTNSSGVPAMSASMTNGQLMIGSTGASPAPATLTAGSGISIANGANSITISGTGSGIGWTEVTGTSQTMTADSGWVTNNAGLVTLTLPVTAAFGTVISVIGKGAGGWKVAQNSGQNIQVGNTSTTVGVGGSIASTNRFDSFDMICTTANTTWTMEGAPQSAGLTIV